MELLPKCDSELSSLMMDKQPKEKRPSILVVEDEVLIRMMVVDALMDVGFETSEAANGKAAFETLAAAGEELRAVILDMGLPDTRGEDLIERIRAIRPKIPIIVTTGYDTNELRRKLRDDPLARILTKPYQPEMLSTILAEWGIHV